MDLPPATPVVLELDPADYALTLDSSAESAGRLTGGIAARADRRVVLRFSGESPPWGDLQVTVTDPALELADALFLVSVLLLTEHHQDRFLHRPQRWGFVDAHTQRRVELPHPPRIETAQALLGGLPVPTRIRLLVEACQIAVPVWTAWARSAELVYFDGVMSMAAVPQDLAEATIASVRTWLADGDPSPLARWRAEYRSLHWPMLEDEWEPPPNVYYSLFAPCNLVDCALDDGSLSAALVCIRQAAAARATDTEDNFLGEPARKAFFLAWWRACVRVLLAEPPGGPPLSSFQTSWRSPRSG